jgi:glycogen operon protein
MNTSPGKPYPLGATVVPGGIRFAVFSRHATAVSIALFDNPEQARPATEIALDPATNRTGDVWHCEVAGLAAGQLYLFRADGPYDPYAGHRFNADLFLVDPYARAFTGGFPWDIAEQFGYDPDSFQGDLAKRTIEGGPSAAGVPKCIVTADDFDWQGDRPLNHPSRKSVIYEAHLRGLTADPTSGVTHPGTYRGLVEKIPYLKHLGITSLELLPVHEFDHNELRRKNPRTGAQLHNYWGYSTLGFFAPKAAYAAGGANGEQVNEFKELVRELHRAGIEIILDVVFNHTSEGNEFGPTHSFRGLDNSIYYMLEDDRRRYRNFAGTGNTLNCNHPVLRRLILDCLHYWVGEMHVDGFRFDLGSILGRDRRGNLLENPPLLELIAEDPILRDTKLIAEAWDAGGAYQVGSFPGGRWAEWNDRYRDDVRRFWRGDHGVTAPFATRLAGSSDLYLRDGRKPFHSINFVTCHDGFTLRDLVSYAHKHNEENGERNRDGMTNNNSNNYGIEGPTRDAMVNAIRLRQQKNMLATLLLSLGTPMVLGGDEFGRTQLGNNNAYCQDTEVSWFNYDHDDEQKHLLEFTRKLIEFRLRHPAFLRPEFFTGQDTDFNKMPDISWFNELGRPVDWARVEQTLALRIDGSRAETSADRDDNDFCLVYHAAAEARQIIMCPPPAGKRWYRVIDTALPHPDDFIPEAESEPCIGSYSCAGRSVVVFLSR